MVAIKVVSLQKLNPKSNEEMRREIELLNSLKDEDCIINLYDHEVKSLIGSLESFEYLCPVKCRLHLPVWCAVIVQTLVVNIVVNLITVQNLIQFILESHVY